MTAKEMFENLGWKKVKNPEVLEPKFDDYYSRGDIVYEYNNESGLACRLYLINRVFGFALSNSLAVEESVEFHLALHQQMKELGWIE